MPPPQLAVSRTNLPDAITVTMPAACLTEVQTAVEVLNKGEDVDHGIAQRIPSAAAVMVDDHVLALAVAVFKAAAGALRGVETPYRGSRSSSVAQVTLALSCSMSSSCPLVTMLLRARLDRSAAMAG